MKTLFKLMLVAAALAFLAPYGVSTADAQGRHPYYLHALSDLRDARAHLNRPDGGAMRDEERNAIEEINKAITEIKNASIDDHKNIEDHTPIDGKMPWAGRLHDARNLLDKAHADCSKEEDDPATRGLQRRILDHIDKAHRSVDAALAIAESR